MANVIGNVKYLYECNTAASLNVQRKEKENWSINMEIQISGRERERERTDTDIRTYVRMGKESLLHLWTVVSLMVLI